MPRERRRRRRQQQHQNNNCVDTSNVLDCSRSSRVFAKKDTTGKKKRERTPSVSPSFSFLFLSAFSLSLFVHHRRVRNSSSSLSGVLLSSILFAKFSRRAFPWCRDGVRATKCAHKRVQKQSRSFYSVMCDFDAFARVRLVVFHSTESETFWRERVLERVLKNTSQILSNRYEPLRFKHTSSIVSCVRVLLNRIFWLTVTDRR